MVKGLENIQIVRLRGREAKPYVDILAQLRIKVFYEYPYLYEGTFDYEKNYLEKYFSSPSSFVVLLKDLVKDQWIGATTSILASDIEDSLQKSLEGLELDLREIFYFGESVLLPEYRGRGFGKVFFAERERFARSIKGIRLLAFCSVEREAAHPLRTKDYRNLDSFWRAQKFQPLNIRATLSWRDRGEKSETSKTMIFWGKYIEEEI
jgi:GNAT superfamily N-acetyltransferase